jgi:hypothetical protein
VDIHDRYFFSGLLDDRMQRQFTWLVSIQLTTMVTVIGVLAAAFLRTL